MRKRIIICCNDSTEADEIKKETEQINQDSQERINEFQVKTPNLTRLYNFINNFLIDRTSTLEAFKYYFIQALDKILYDGEFVPDKKVIERLKKDFLALRAKDPKSKTQWGFAYEKFENGNVIVHAMTNMKLIKEFQVPIGVISLIERMNKLYM